MAAVTRQPVSRAACPDASTASRRICSTRGWGACWPGSATRSLWARPSPNASWMRVISRPVSVVQNHVGRPVDLERSFLSELLGQTPAAEMLHRPGRNRLGARAEPVHVRAGLDHRAGDAVQVQFHGRREPDRAAAGDKDGHPSGWAGGGCSRGGLACERGRSWWGRSGRVRGGSHQGMTGRVWSAVVDSGSSGPSVLAPAGVPSGWPESQAAPRA